MAASYNPALIDALDRVRRIVGDIDMAMPLMQDEEYNAILVAYPNEADAAATVLENLAAQYANRPQSIAEAGGMSVVWGDRAKTWLALALRLRQLRATDSGSGTGGFWSAPSIHQDDEADTHSEYYRGGL
jgi:hypothetical protein